jgi:hypothetical protein
MSVHPSGAAGRRQSGAEANQNRTKMARIA